MKTAPNIKELKAIFGRLKPINDNTIPVIVKVMNNGKKIGLWMQYWTYEDIIIGEKKDNLGNKIVYITEY